MNLVFMIKSLGKIVSRAPWKRQTNTGILLSIYLYSLDFMGDFFMVIFLHLQNNLKLPKWQVDYRCELNHSLYSAFIW